MQDVESSQILQIGYDPETLKARVLFKKKDGSPGATYEYDNVPQDDDRPDRVGRQRGTGVRGWN